MISIKLPDLQINFAHQLVEIRSLCLQDALISTVGQLDIATIDSELHTFVKPACLAVLAQHGMRGELLFMVPCILIHNPKLLAYYRCLLGYSQKEFYNVSGSNLGKFQSMEQRDTLSEKQLVELPELCQEMNRNAEYLLEGLTAQMLCPSFFDQLTLLTLGANLRGSNNVKKGANATAEVFKIIEKIVGPKITRSDKHHIYLTNNSDRQVVIQFAPDPDIVIQEELGDNIFKKLIAIEVKGGQDIANIHNRIGEAEKSHQKAKADGYVECWTIVNVAKLDHEKARQESPTTNRFFSIANLQKPSSSEYQSFSMQIKSATGI